MSRVSSSSSVRPRTHRERAAKSPGSHTRCGWRPALPRLRTAPSPVIPPPRTTGGSFITAFASAFPSRPESQRMAHGLARDPWQQVAHEWLVMPAALQPKSEERREVVDALARQVEQIRPDSLLRSTGSREASVHARRDRLLVRAPVRVSRDGYLLVEDLLEARLAATSDPPPRPCSAWPGRVVDRVGTWISTPAARRRRSSSSVTMRAPAGTASAARASPRRRTPLPWRPPRRGSGRASRGCRHSRRRRSA